MWGNFEENRIGEGNIVTSSSDASAGADINVNDVDEATCSKKERKPDPGKWKQNINKKRRSLGQDYV